MRHLETTPSNQPAHSAFDVDQFVNEGVDNDISAPSKDESSLPHIEPSPSSLTRVLVVDDDQSMCEFVAASLPEQLYQVSWYTSAQRALDELELNANFDLVLLDLNMPVMDGNTLCKRILELYPDIPVIVVTGDTAIESAIASIRAGAYDFLVKPVDIKVLTVAAQRAAQFRRLGQEVKRLKHTSQTSNIDGIVGASPSMRRLLQMVHRVADNEASVLITGESGTGKELVARALHQQSGRTGPFVAINCAAVPANLIESELFGHARGAFTDAKNMRQGLFLQANKGTLFLDEVGELPLDVQPKLLRALQERTARPVGGDTEFSFDARIVAATNRDLETEVYEKRFREDLFYRINVIHLEVPALRERSGDVLLLAQSFIDRMRQNGNKRVTGISSAAAERLLAYDWPGNVRELENCVARAMALTRFEEIAVGDLPQKIRDHRDERIILTAEDTSELVKLEELERRYIFQVMRFVGGNKSRAAAILGLDRRTLYRKLDRYEKSAAE